MLPKKKKLVVGGIVVYDSPGQDKSVIIEENIGKSGIYR